MKNIICILFLQLYFISCSPNNSKSFCIDYPKPVVCYQVKSLGKISIFTKSDSIILFMNHYISSKESNVLKNVYAYIDIKQEKIIRIDSFDIENIERFTSLEKDQYTVSTNNPNAKTIQSSYEPWGRGGKQNSKIVVLNNNKEIVKKFLFPCFKNSSINLLFSNTDYLIIASRNIYDYDDLSNWIYVYRISDLISTNCTNYLSESIDFDKKIPEPIMKKFDPSLIGTVEF